MLSEQAKLVIGKTDQEDGQKWLPLWMHLRDTGAVMRYLLEAYIPEGTREYLACGNTPEELECLACFLGMVHDLGKDIAVFQEFLYAGMDGEWQEKARKKGFPSPSPELRGKHDPKHAVASAVLLEQAGCPAAVVEIAGAHHGTPRADSRTNRAEYQLDMLQDHYYGKSTSFYRETQRELLDWAREEAGIARLSDLPFPTQGAEMILSGLLVMADWIASNTYYFPLIGIGEEPDESLYPARIETGIRRLRLPDYWHPSDERNVEKLCRERFSFPKPNEIQEAAGEIAGGLCKPGIMIIEAQMGRGKTEAALLAAEMMARQSGRGGLFFGLPTQATANGLFPRIVSWAGHQESQGLISIRLAHGMAQFNSLFMSIATNVGADDASGLVVHEWFRGGKQALLSDYVIGTVDQVLLASLMRQHVMLRHLGLATKVIIVDECHAYDAYMNVYLMRTLAWLGTYGVPVVILSATLPCGTRSRLVDAYLNRQRQTDEASWRTSEQYPLITWTDGGEVFQKAVPLLDEPTQVEIHRTTDDRIGPILRERLAEGGCAGIICNTVARAQQLYAELQTVFPGEMLLFHARFLTEDRAEIEQRLLRYLGKPVNNNDRPRRLIVVGTQVLEQSLDIDFDLLMTDLCPMDLILQRIGRLHRHKGRIRPDLLRKPECWVIGMDEDTQKVSALIYSEYLLKRTEMLLGERVALPQDIAPLVQAAYRETDVPPELAEAFEEQPQKRKEAEAKAECYCLRWPPRKPGSRKTICGLVDVRFRADEQEAEASVRDGEESITVILVVEYADGIGLVPWHGGGKRYHTGQLSEEEAMVIGRERIGLPMRFGGKRAGVTIAELEKAGERFREWKKSPLLHSALFLVLDDTLNARLLGYELHYSQNEGLVCRKEEGGN
ncbi:MAG: CRISPR-associated helicase Cas3' [Clostridia bacterium]|nr:CRISPR-associated helicase Cas3' [Clostridia bacterium]